MPTFFSYLEPVTVTSCMSASPKAGVTESICPFGPFAVPDLTTADAKERFEATNKVLKTKMKILREVT